MPLVPRPRRRPSHSSRQYPPPRSRRPTAPASARYPHQASSLITLQTRLRYTTMVRPPRRRGDSRRHLRRQGLLGHQRDAQHRAREAREGGRRHKHESGDGQRRGLLVPPDREERRRHARPQGVRDCRSECAAGQAEVLQRRTGRELQTELTEARAAADAANRRTTEALAAYQQEYPGKLQFVYGPLRYAKPFLVRSIWHDGQFTYIKADATELPALYEVKDGKPALVNFQVQNGTYIVPKVLDHGYLSLGKERFEFLQQGR